VQTIFPISGGAGLTLTTAKYYTPSGRLIQRDYAGISRYNYYLRRDDQNGNGNGNGKANGAEFRTDTGRKVFGGGGITPDISVKSPRPKAIQVPLLEAIFLFTRELVNGQIPEITEYRTAEINFNHVLKADEFPVTDKLLEAFKNFLVKQEKVLHIPATVVTDNIDFVKQELRHDIVTAAYGSETAEQVRIENHPVVLKGIAELANTKEALNKK
jgi:carboxyl-terminal processing protease